MSTVVNSFLRRLLKWKSVKTMASALEVEAINAAARPLVIFYDCETTGLNTSRDSIVEIGAIVMSATDSSAGQPDQTFSRLVKVDREIPLITSNIHGIYAEDLVDEENFQEVFSTFCSWIKSHMEIHSKKTGSPVYPVVGAHNGFHFDFPLLFSEVHQHKIGFDFFRDNKVSFFDTYRHLSKLKDQEKYTVLSNQSSLSLQKLYERYFPFREYRGHRALNDAKYLSEILLETELNSSLSIMETISFEEMESRWQSKYEE